MTPIEKKSKKSVVKNCSFSLIFLFLFKWKLSVLSLYNRCIQHSAQNLKYKKNIWRVKTLFLTVFLFFVFVFFLTLLTSHNFNLRFSDTNLIPVLVALFLNIRNICEIQYQLSTFTWQDSCFINNIYIYIKIDDSLMSIQYIKTVSYTKRIIVRYLFHRIYYYK